MRPKVTYANVVATLALFIALGGASYAALKLPKNSVGSKQLKSNAVTTAKVKNEAISGAKVMKGTLTGTQIDVSTLGTIPSAADARTLGGRSASQITDASKLRCPERMKLHGGICFQEEAHPPDIWSEAMFGCSKIHMRLPTIGELVGFEYDTFTEAPTGEWTESLDYAEGASYAWIANANKYGYGYGLEKVNEKQPYRCVTAASN